MKKRYTEEQIIKSIKRHEAGSKIEDICREFGISNGTFYNRRSKFVGLELMKPNFCSSWNLRKIS